MVYSDSYFKIGKTHLICQDYALHSEGHISLSDGCSSSPNTDIGSRLLCLINKNNRSLVADSYCFIPECHKIIQQLQRCQKTRKF